MLCYTGIAWTVHIALKCQCFKGFLLLCYSAFYIYCLSRSLLRCLILVSASETAEVNLGLCYLVSSFVISVSVCQSLRIIIVTLAIHL